MNQFQFFLGAGALCCEHVGGGGGVIKGFQINEVLHLWGSRVPD